MLEKIGQIDPEIIALLGLNLSPGQPILVGPQNLEHMKGEHPEDYLQFGAHLSQIVNNPDYVSLHPENGSIQFIKEFPDRVMVAVRATNRGTLIARTLFTMSPEKWDNYMLKGAIKRVETKE
ncbi:hypothetical protein M2444_006781 [Paenibacillus sp. PastF-3]|uniref:PBECR3 domain-containing polyvalent protein n=1 Tax=Paenibacillus sp. PastF-3 TaxID=2940626 RepID=UPI002476C4D7|nr:PBECR2 nuclease fold domain-containing protein [Paenibacillus sp. PastF-3]MDH6374917.1 hypothetical protein [Paenibacillus sp. PastF-3]